jgi:predicted HTH transcriptional regulator
MSLISNMPLGDIEEKHLEALIKEKTPERKVIEYKSELPKFDDPDDKKEFLADVSSFANASGGDLIYGINAKDGVPEYLKGLEIDVPAERKVMQLESIIRSNIEPKIPGLSIVEIPVKGS